MGKVRTGFVLLLIATVFPSTVFARTLTHSSVRKNRQPPARLLHRDEGLAIIAAVLKLRPHLVGYDCSHLVHAVYKQAGFRYKYATTGQLYSGTDEFRRVTDPQPGDLVVFPDRGKNGHVGIMVNPAQGLFFSGLNHGPSVSSYLSPYWRARGYPHFLRYVRSVPSKRPMQGMVRVQ